MREHLFQNLVLRALKMLLMLSANGRLLSKKEIDLHDELSDAIEEKETGR